MESQTKQSNGTAHLRWYMAVGCIMNVVYECFAVRFHISAPIGLQKIVMKITYLLFDGSQSVSTIA